MLKFTDLKMVTSKFTDLKMVTCLSLGNERRISLVDSLEFIQEAVHNLDCPVRPDLGPLSVVGLR